MLELPDVTLVMIETQERQLARMAVEECLEKVDFGDILICTDQPEAFVSVKGARLKKVENWPTKLGWSQCFWNLWPHINTSHALCIQWDSWIVSPERWRNGFLSYDYIGAPWFHPEGLNVGNGGFCLRSQRLLNTLYNDDRFPCTTALDDLFLCRHYRPALEDLGMAWAPHDTALEFSFECFWPPPVETPSAVLMKTHQVEGIPWPHFGFHGCFNFGNVLSKEKLLERALIMRESPYIRKNEKMWTNFCMHPLVKEVLA